MYLELEELEGWVGVGVKEVVNPSCHLKLRGLGRLGLGVRELGVGAGSLGFRVGGLGLGV
jgi:hypothetical protein